MIRYASDASVAAGAASTPMAPASRIGTLAFP